MRTTNQLTRIWGQHYLQLVNIEGLRSEEAHMQSIKLDPNFLEAWAHLTQFHQDLANSEKALECLQQVLQVDGSEEFNSGFGSHMPLILGQAKGVHYFPNYERTLDVAKAVIREKMHVYSKGDTFIYLRMENCKRGPWICNRRSVDALWAGVWKLHGPC